MDAVFVNWDGGHAVFEVSLQQDALVVGAALHEFDDVANQAAQLHRLAARLSTLGKRQHVHRQ